MKKIKTDLTLTEINTTEIANEGIERIKQHCETTANHAMAVMENESPIFYCISPALFELLDDVLEDKALTAIVKERLKDDVNNIPINIDDL